MKNWIRSNINKLYLIILCIIALIFVGNLHNNNSLINNIILVLFLIDYIYRIWKSDNKIKFILSHPIDALAILPFSQGFKLLALYRLFFLLSDKKRTSLKNNKLIKILKENNLAYLLAWLVVILSISSFLITLVEPTIPKYEDALWWSIVTTTTVGYGDISPETQIGRAIASILMILGIGIMGLLTSSIVTFFSRENSNNNVSSTYNNNIEIKNFIDNETYDNFLSLDENTKKYIIQKLKDDINFFSNKK